MNSESFEDCNKGSRAVENVKAVEDQARVEENCRELVEENGLVGELIMAEKIAVRAIEQMSSEDSKHGEGFVLVRASDRYAKCSNEVTECPICRIDFEVETNVFTCLVDIGRGILHSFEKTLASISRYTVYKNQTHFVFHSTSCICIFSL